MNIWILKSGEPIPQRSDGRPMRAGLLSEYLANKEHKVTWWTSSFDHQEQKFIWDEHTRFKQNEHLSIQAIHALPGYQNNISFKRFLNHKRVANNFASLASHEKKPDCIFACLPTIDMAYAALKYGKERNIPVIIDLRDKWPAIFESAVPKALRFAIRIALRRQYKMARDVLKNCNTLVAISQEYLDWATSFGNRAENSSNHVIPIGYPAQPLHSRGSKNDQSINVFFSGTLGFSYDIETVVNAARILEKTHPHIRFSLAGKGEKEHIVQQGAAELKNLCYLGWLKKIELHEQLQKCDIGLSAYTKKATQSIPNKPIEYMAYSLPQINSITGEMKDILASNQAGLQYTAGNAECLSEQIKKLATNSTLRKKLAQNALVCFQKNFELQSINAKLEALIKHQIKAKF
ncbi:glycosyl transferase, group 1 family protein [Verrucomicrobiia bacterium DG1235]|nr:glycosyl transferase, group 1 family protein [Verrucomicrobiae bacterium DG1235]